ncbi:MAG: hypothetical protein ACKPEA_10260 [Planctomycetota bacterium]
MVGQQSVFGLGNSPWGTAYRESNFGAGRAGTREVFYTGNLSAGFVNPNSFSIDAYYDGSGYAGFTDYEIKTGSIAGSGVSGGKFGVKTSAPAPSAGYTAMYGGINATVGAQYTFNSALDLTGGKVSITGSGTMTDRVGQTWQAKGNGALVSSEIINLHQASGFTVNGADAMASNYLNTQPSYMYLQVVLLSGLGVDPYGVGNYQQRATVDLAFLGTQSLGNMEFSMSDFMNNFVTGGPGGFDFSNVQAIQFTFQTVSGNGTSINWDIDSFSVSAVPAPGAAALLGLAGFVGRRRRA